MKTLTATLLACLLSSSLVSAARPPGPGSALRFDGIGSKVAIDDVGAITGSFTVELWIKPDDLAGHGVFGSRSLNDCGFDIHIYDGNKIHADIGNGSTWATTAATANYDYQAGSWLYIAYVVTPANYTVYADGKPIGSGNYSATVPVLRDARHPLFLGWSGFGNEFFKGEMAEVRIWNTALSARRIASIWNRAVAIPQANLVACYRFAEGSGTIAHDSTGNGNHATLLSGPRWVSADPTGPKTASSGEIALREIRYDARLSDDEARFTADINAEAAGPGESSVKLFEGDVAVLPAKLPDSLKIVREGNRYLLVAAREWKFNCSTARCSNPRGPTASLA